MKIWAHRGCSYAWPENTIEAFVAACALPVTGIELDIQLTRDGHIVVIHDEKVDRTTDGAGEVQGFTLEELKKLKIQTHPAEDGSMRHTRIPTMEEVFALVKPYCLEKGLLINIELKNSIIRYEGMEDQILGMVREWGLEEYIIYSSFNPDSVKLLKEKNPAVKTGILASPLSACLAFAEENPVDALHPYIKELDAADLRSRTKLPVRAWNIRRYEPFYPSRKEVEMQDLEALEQAGVTDIFTNVPERYLLGEEEGAPVQEPGKDKIPGGYERVSPRLVPGACFHAEKGFYEKGRPDCMADFHFYRVNPGDGVECNVSGYEYNLASYSEETERRLIYTYCYQEEENWATWRGDFGEEGWRDTGTLIRESGWIRIAARRRDRRAVSEADCDVLEGSLHLIRREEKYQEKRYFHKEAAITAGTVREKRKKNSLVFALMADSHYVINGRWEDSMANLREVHGKVKFDAMIHLGDLTDGMVPLDITKEYTGSVMKDLRSLGVPVYITLGNHDTNYFHNNPEWMSRKEASRYYLNREEPWYYVDFEEQKLRCLFLYSFDHNEMIRYGFPEEEVNWVEDILSGTPDDFSVIVFSHVPLLPEMHFWSDKIRNSDEMLDALDGYVKRGGSILGYIHGHNHADQIVYTQHFPIIAVGCAKCEDFKDKKPEGSVTYDRKMGTVSQELWDVMVVDTEEKKIDFVRFGAGEDRCVQV